MPQSRVVGSHCTSGSCVGDTGVPWVTFDSCLSDEVCLSNTSSAWCDLCDTFPANYCSAGDAYQYSTYGTCTTGSCAYTPTFVDCPSGCSGGSCTTCTACAWGTTLDSSNGGFTTSGTTTWAWGAPSSGPMAAHSGANVWATNLSGTYNNSEDGYLISPVINLSAYSGSGISINWWQWFQVESSFDYVSLEVSSDGGTSYSVVYGPTSTSAAAWGRQTVTVGSSYAVSNFRFRLHFTSDGSVVYAGWYVDDFCVAPASAGTGSSESFDSGNGGYTVTLSGTTTSWAWGAPSSGPGAAHSGSYLWATYLAGNYYDYEDGYIASPSINLSGLSAEPSIPLTWWSWYAGETCCDYARVDASADGGTSWTTVWGPNYGSTTGSWVNQSVSLATSYAVPAFRVRFYFHSDLSINYAGWYVDDVVVGTSTPSVAACEP
jgi:hypothetical protein